METPIRLDIVKGILPAIQDPYSAEVGYEAMSLLDSSGIALRPQGWQMKIASLKRGGVWGDSPLHDGRQLIASARGNVVETLRCTVSNHELHQRQAIVKRLQHFMVAAERQSTTGYQIEPVYLALQAACTKAEQFALIYTISIDNTTDPFDLTSNWDFDLAIEREPAWRMVVPPGGNPRLYHFWKQGKVPGVDFDYTDMSLYEGTDHFHYETIYNRHEWDNADYLTPLAKNYIDIAAEDIPGDAPALITLAVGAVSLLGWQVHIAQSTKPITIYDRDGDQINQANILNAGDCDTGGLITKSVDGCGVYSNNSVANRYVGTYSMPASTTRTDLITWSRLNGATGTRVFELNLNRGTYAAFLRCKQTSGAAGDVEVRLSMTEGDGLNILTLDYQAMPIVAAAVGCAKRFDALYLGRFSIPLGGRSVQSFDGRGLAVGDRNSGGGNIILKLTVRNNNAAIRTTEFLDLILMPVDEAYCVGLEISSSVTSKNFMFDNTGYLMHGEVLDIAQSGWQANPDPIYQIDQHTIELRGQIPQLTPGVNNRLYLFNRAYLTNAYYSAAGGADADWDMTVRLNIIPRCYGIAEVEPNP